MFNTKLSLIKSRNLISFILAVLIFIGVYYISKWDISHNLNKKIQNSLYTVYNIKKESSIADNLIVVEIDNKTLEDGSLGRFPFDRKSYIPIIENLNSKGASIIGLDIIFNEKTSIVSDNSFANAIKKAGNIVIGSYLTVVNKDNPIITFNKGLFDKEVKATGFFSPQIDPFNHVVYSISPYVKTFRGDYYNHFSISILKLYYGLLYDKDFGSMKPKIDDKYYYITDYLRIPLARKGGGNILINFEKNEEFDVKKKRVSFIDVYDSKKFEELTKHIDFKDKIVLVGASADGIKDIFYTPNGIEPGVYVHANMINTVLTKSYLQYFDKFIEYILLFFLIFLSVYFNLSRSGYILLISNVAIIVIFLFIFPLFIIYYTYLLLNFPVELLIALIISLTVSNIIKYLIESKSKDKLNKALSEYVSVDVANEILSGEGKVNLDGENKNIAIFFSDIEGFTSVSEQFSAEKLVSFLREYLSSMSNIILDEKGFINKYEGDAIMALWGVFRNEGAETYRICVTALDQQRKLKELNIKWKERGFGRIKARIGIHYGSAIIGNIGAEGRKMEFTALGDNVNLASRLEGVNKFYGTYICASEDIYKKEKNNFEFRYLDEIRVKGKNNSVKIYELISSKLNVTQIQKDIIFNFKIGTNLYKEKKFKEALPIFTELAKHFDGPSITYKERCEFYIETPPDEYWDGIWTMDSK